MHVVWGYVLWVEGKRVESTVAFRSAGELGEAVRGLAAGLGLKGGSWAEMAPGVKVCCGAERGGWLLVAYRAQVHTLGGPKAKTRTEAQALKEGRLQKATAGESRTL